MNIRDLRYLVALADLQHFGKAAKACHVSQPALSMQIKKLEEYLGVCLVEREHKPLLLTPTGKKIVEQAREILNKIGEMIETATIARDPFRGDLHLGVIPTLGPYLLPYIVPAISAQYPHIKLYLVEDITENLIQRLRHGTLDAALLALPVSNELHTQEIFEEPFLLAVPKTHKLSKKPEVRIGNLINESIFLLQEGHCLREQALAVCSQMSALETQNFRGTSLETLRYMVSSGAGMTLMPKLSCRDDDGITYLNFAQPSPSRKIALVRRHSCARTELLDGIAHCIKKQALMQ